MVGGVYKVQQLTYAASDMFLVPSMFKPCGLTQMRSELCLT
jgi:glycogen synthase